MKLTKQELRRQGRSSGRRSRWRHADSRQAQGIALIDCLIYIALLALILGMAFAAFYEVIEQSTNLERNTADIARALRAGERWREDVRMATESPRVIQGAEGTVFQIPHNQAEVSYIFRTSSVFRQAAPAGQQEELLPNVNASEFHHDSRQHVTAWRWELELKGKQKVSRLKPLFTFQAVTPPESQR